MLTTASFPYQGQLNPYHIKLVCCTIVSTHVHGPAAKVLHYFFVRFQYRYSQNPATAIFVAPGD
jgi:hypothetical protein